MKKKGIALILVLALALTLIGVAVAETLKDQTNMEMTTTAQGDLKDGETFKVTVTNKKDVALDALTFYVDFPKEDLTVTNVTWKLNGTDISEKEPEVVDGTVIAGGCSEWSGENNANDVGKVGFYYLNVAEETNATPYEKGVFVAEITFAVKGVHVSGGADSASVTLHEDSAGGDGLIQTLINWMNQENATVSFAHMALPVVLGDVNNDNSIDAQDAQNIQRYAAGLSSSITAENTDAADVNKDGSVDAQDAQNIQRYAAGLSSSFDTIS